MDTDDYDILNKFQNEKINSIEINWEDESGITIDQLANQDEYKFLGDGIKHKKIDDFIGNYIALSTKGSMIRLETFLSEGKPIKKSTHCGLSKEEMEVPVIVLR